MTAPYYPGQPAQQPQGPGPYGQPQGYYAPQQPPAPPAYAQQPQPYAQPSYGAPQGYPGQPAQYGGYPQPPVPQAAPLAPGSMAAFDSQPVGGSAPGLTFKDMPIGATWVLQVKRELRDSDVRQDTDYTTKQPKFRRDGSPLFVLGIPCTIYPQTQQQAQQHPAGEATLYVRGGVREALDEAFGGKHPVQGDTFQLTLTERRNTGQGNPKNIFRVQILQRGPGATGGAPEAPAAPAQPPVHVPEPQPAPVPPQAPTQQWTPPAGQQEWAVQQPAGQQAQVWAPPGQYAPQQPAGQPTPPAGGVDQPLPNVQQPSAQEAQAPAQQPAGVPGLPAMDPAQQALLAQLQAAQQGGQR